MKAKVKIYSPILFLVSFFFFLIWSHNTSYAQIFTEKNTPELARVLYLATSDQEIVGILIELTPSELSEQKKQSIKKKSFGDLRRESAQTLTEIKQNVELSNKSLAAKFKNLGYAQQTSACHLSKKSQVGNIKNFKTYKHFNIIALRAEAGEIKRLIEDLSQDPNVKHIYYDAEIAPPKPEDASSDQGGGVSSTDIQAQLDKGITFGLEKIRARDLWNQGITGQGIIVASIDSGVDINHPALIGKMASIGNGALGWYDANVNAKTGLPEPNPIDLNGHGTHTIGTMVGGEVEWTTGHKIAIGVAPGAKYYSVRVWGGLPAQDSIYLEAANWLMDPDDNPNTLDHPHVVNNSWSMSSVGNTSEFFRDKVILWKSIGIVPIFSAGNLGESGPSSTSAPGNYPESINVGSTNKDDIIASSSSRGPITYDGLAWIKPDLSAPGVHVISARASGTGLSTNAVGDNQNLYIESGTSMAAPHVAGSCALLLQKFPKPLISDVESRLEYGSIDLGIPGKDNTYGYGRIDVVNAVQKQPGHYIEVLPNISGEVSGVGASKFQSGETVSIGFMLRNRWLPSTGVVATLVTSDQKINLIQDRVNIGDMLEEERRDVLPGQGFLLKIPDDIKSKYTIPLVIRISASENYLLEIPIELIVFPPKNFSNAIQRTISNIDSDGVDEIIEVSGDSTLFNYSKTLTVGFIKLIFAGYENLIFEQFLGPFGDQMLHVYNVKNDRPNPVYGWPKSIQSKSKAGAVVGEVIQSNPGPEIVYISNPIPDPSINPIFNPMKWQNNKLFIFGYDGTVLLEQVIESDQPLYVHSLVLADLNGDKENEIIMSCKKLVQKDSSARAGLDDQFASFIYIFKQDGTIYSSAWPKIIEDERSMIGLNHGGFNHIKITHLAVGDVGGNGALEIVYSSIIGSTTGGDAPYSVVFNPISSRIFIFNDAGSELRGWEGGKLLSDPDGEDLGITPPVLADLDQNKTLEIIVTTQGNSHPTLLPVLRIYNFDGRLLKKQSHCASGRYSTAVGDLFNQDGNLEIVSSCIFDKDGNVLDYSVRQNDSEVALADVDNDGSVEIIGGGRDGGIHSAKYDITPNLFYVEAEGWPKFVDSADAVLTNYFPSIGNFDGDSNIEILVGGYLLEIPYNRQQARIEWPMFRSDEKHSNVYRKKFIRGNANNDDRVDISDAIYILNYLFNTAALNKPPVNVESLDINDNGIINISDAINLLQFLFTNGPPPAPPYPDPGVDPIP